MEFVEDDQRELGADYGYVGQPKTVHIGDELRHRSCARRKPHRRAGLSTPFLKRESYICESIL